MAIFKIAVDKFFDKYAFYMKGQNMDSCPYGLLRSLSFIDKKLNYENVGDISQDYLEDLYFEHYWIKNNYHTIASQEIANKMLDVSINMSNKLACLFLQQALNTVCDDINIPEDGISILQTIEYANLIQETNQITALLYCFAEVQLMHYYYVLSCRQLGMDINAR